MKCLICQEKIEQVLSWVTLFTLVENQLACEECMGKFIKISGNTCKKCGRKTIKEICQDCLIWESYYQGKGLVDPLQVNQSIFIYNDWFKQIITEWKYTGDYELGYLFQIIFLKSFQKFASRYALGKEIMIVPIPLSYKRLQHRAFNQAKMLAKFLPYQVADILIREEGEKQAKKTRKERLSSKNPFQIRKKLNKSVVIVDDIYTTGTTIRHAANILKIAGAKEIYSFTLVRG